eukprot:5129290-Prymnesium_polylepis.1
MARRCTLSCTRGGVRGRRERAQLGRRARKAQRPTGRPTGREPSSGRGQDIARAPRVHGERAQPAAAGQRAVDGRVAARALSLIHI